jgi:Zn-dependent peptidase ImmA (M78 family)
LVLHRNKPTGTPEIEREADYFARAFLLPRAAFRREYPHSGKSNWEFLFQLKRRWRASVADMIQRASDLSLINGVEHLRLYKELSRQGWLKAEPYEFEHEPPEILPTAFKQLKTAKGIDHSNVARVLGWTHETLLEITNVPVESPSPRAVVRTLPLGRVKDA